MALSPSDGLRAAAAPLTSGGGHRVFALDTSSDSITLAAGTHEILNAGSELAFVRLGSAVSVPSDKAAETSAQGFVPANGALTVFVAADTALYAQVASGTTTLHIMRKVPA